MNRYICIHGHFYQPPRENPWLDEIEIEDSAYPFHDWNEKITAECYAPNASSRILQSGKKIINIVNNYANISFNFGPTLISWIERKKPELYKMILDADRESQKKFSGHGSAIAQPYSHIILPLASSRDKQTAVIWGIRDFEHRFHRKPEGMWLPETAVDYETLEVLAEHDILFTILAPHQATAVKKCSETGWTDCTGTTIDTRMPYRCRLPSGRTISVFFYDGKLSNEIAFSDILQNGERFAERMISSFPEGIQQPCLLNLANDGETYGHHHRFADMALAYALHTIEEKKLAIITNYGEYREKFPPTHDVIIRENTSWSCSHGIERWRDDCGCRSPRDHPLSDQVFSPDTHVFLIPSGETTSWNQKWRKPLRGAVTWLNESLSDLYEQEGSTVFSDPLAALHDYSDLIRDRRPESIQAFFLTHGRDAVSSDSPVQGLKLLEMMKNALFMQTSCGWFFDEISGIETIQVLMYACRAMQLARDVSGVDFEPEFIGMLRQAHGNIAKMQDGGVIYTTVVRPSIIDISRVAFHYAITSLIEQYPKELTLYSYSVRNEGYRQCMAGQLNLCCGYALFRSEITRAKSLLMFAALHMGNHNFLGGVSPYTSRESFDEMETDLWNAFSRSDIPGLIHCIDEHFVDHSYSVWQLFKEGKRKVFDSILNTTLSTLETGYRQIYSRYFTLLGAMREIRLQPPPALEFPMQYVLNQDLVSCLKSDNINYTALKSSVEAIVQGNFRIDTTLFSFIAPSAITRKMQAVEQDPLDIARIEDLNTLFSILSPLTLDPDLRDSQNRYFFIGKHICDMMRLRKKNGDSSAEDWLIQFERLGDFLGVMYP